MKSFTQYWNPLAPENREKWTEVADTNGNIRQLTLTEDPELGQYTRLTWFAAGYSTEKFGPQVHDYPEEIYIVSGRLYDTAFDLWLEAGYYASRPPGEVHGPFQAATDVLVLEISFPGQKTRA